MQRKISIRPATADDSSDLALLVDAATRRLASHLWQSEAGVGTSPFEIGREAIRADRTKPYHHANWHVAVIGGRVAGGLNGYVLPQAQEGPQAGPAVVRPLNELKLVAAGAWHVAAAAVFPEFRNRGVGQALIEHSFERTASSGAIRTTLMVGSFNPSAQRLYRKLGFREWDERTFVSFPGSDPEGKWLLMYRDA